MNIYDPYEYGITQWHNSLPGGMLALYWIILGISIAAMWILFTKAHEEGWASIVPFYNMYVLFKITWQRLAVFTAAHSDRGHRHLDHHDGETRAGLWQGRRFRLRPHFPQHDF